MPVKVSVVVATYNAPPDLERLVASLDAQSLPSDEFEMIFVDDGSTDDTLQRLQDLAATRPNMLVSSIPNSGWPGRPRNVGTAQASGDYVFYSDHDDYVFPEALERMHRFAVEHDLDVVHPKEVVKGWRNPGWDSWRAQTPRVEQWTQSMLQCITPHKLYRRAFLEEKGVRYPEGRVRLEDFSLNGLAWARTDAVGILADYPCYQWIIHETNSHKAGYDFDVYWRCFEESAQPLLELPDGDKKDQLLIRWYRSRVLERVKALGTYEPGEVDRFLGVWSDLLALFPPHLDAKLNPGDRPRSVLLRQGARDALLELSELDRKVSMDVTESSAEWSEGQVVVRLRTRLNRADGSPFGVRREGERLLRDVPASLAALTEPGDWDLTDTVARAFGEVIVRGRDGSVDWNLPTTSEVRVVESDQGLAIEAEMEARLDPATAAFGNPLTDEVWDVFFRVAGLGFGGTRRVRAPEGLSAGAVVHGRSAVLFSTKGGFVALDLTLDPGRLLAASGARPSDLRAVGGGTEVSLPALHVVGEAELAATLHAEGTSRPGRLVARGGGAVLVVDGPPPTTGTVRVELGGRGGVLMRLPEPPQPPTRRARHVLGRAARRLGLRK